jgi:outer membrane protein OmpA-like peptidoglycan-associated protein
MRNSLSRAVLPFLLVSSVLSGCTSTASKGDAVLNQENWPICTLIGAAAGGGLGAIESSSAAGIGAGLGAIVGSLICYTLDGDQDADGVHDRRDTCPDTPSGSTVFPNGCPVKALPAPLVTAEPAPEPEPAPAQDEVIVLSDLGGVLFATGSAELSADSKDLLADIANRLMSQNLVSVKVTGFTDSVGSEASNQALSERRAQSVADFLEGQGVPAEKITQQGLGESNPVGDNATAEGRAANRRVEIAVDR